MSNKIAGGCYCGKVKFAFSGPASGVINCHCGMCRALSGADYTSWVVVPRANLEFEAGESEMHTFKVSDQSEKSFCSHCGTPVITLDNKYPDIYAFPRGILKEALQEDIQGHYFVTDKASWIDIRDDLPKFGGESGYEKF